MKKTLLTLLLVALVGCGKKEDEKKSEGKTDNTSSPPTPTTGEKDPRGVQAKAIAEVLEDHRKKIGGNLDAVTKTVQIARDEKGLTDIKTIERLRSNATIAISNVNQMSEELLSLDRELRHAQNAFAAFASGYAERAEDYRDYENKNALLAWSHHYQRLADSVPAERKRIAEFRVHVQPLLEYMRESRQILSDYHLFLTTYHDRTFPESEAAAYLERFRVFTQQFEQFRKFIDDYKSGVPAAPSGGGTLAKVTS